jgi:phosphoribosylglycinamide formyltransferase-1
MDTGPIIAQRAVPIHDGEPLEQLEERIHEVEHELYPAVLKTLLEHQ